MTPAAKRLLLFSLGLDMDAKIAFSAMTVQPSGARKRLYSNLIKALKTSGVWSKLDVFYITATHDAQAARLNLKNPGTFTLSLVSAPTFTADHGYAGDGIDDALDTGFTPLTQAVQSTLNNTSLGLWSRTSAQALAPIGAEAGGTAVAFVRPRNTSDAAVWRVNTDTLSSQGNTDGKGFYVGVRTASGADRLYRNGAQFGSDSSTTSTNLSGTSLWLCGSNTGVFSTVEVAAGFWSAGLSASEVAAFYAALSVYMQNVGAA